MRHAKGLIGLLTLVLASSVCQADIVTDYAAMGDSLTAGRNFRTTWVQHCVANRGLYFGTDNIYNRARNGATTQSLLSGGQHTYVADLVAGGDVDVAFLWIGGNDFLYSAPDMASGALSGAALVNFESNVVSRIQTATDTVLAADPTGFALVGIPDITLTPAAYLLGATPEQLAPMVSAIDDTNDMLRALAESRQIVFVDCTAMMRDILLGPLVVGGVAIDTTTIGDATHFFRDEIHPGAVGEAIIANMMMTAVNMGYGTTYAPLSDFEILSNAGLAASYAGETFSQTVNYCDYITSYVVPEPGALILFAFGLAPIVFSKAQRG